MRRFLQFIVDAELKGDRDSLKESVLAVVVFDRRPGYDPKLDSIVRVEARRLRGKLLEYYSAEGAADPVRIVLEKGTYRPEFVAVEPGASTAPAGKRRRASLYYPAAAVVALLIAAVAWRAFSRSAPPVSRLFTTYAGSETRPAFSPDGQSVAFMWNGGGATAGIYVQRVDAESPALISSGKGTEIIPAWWPDGTRVAFFRQAAQGRFDVVSAAAIGGGETVLANVAGDAQWLMSVDFSPDGRFLLVSDRPDASGPRRLVTVDLRAGRRVFLTSPPPGRFGDCQASFSPDGKHVLFTRTSTEEVQDLFVQDVTPNGDAAGDPRQLTRVKRGIAGSAWSADGRTIVFAAKLNGARANLWRIPARGGEPEIIPEAGDAAYWPAIARRKNRLVYANLVNDVNIYALEPASDQPPAAVVASTMIDTSPQVSPDGAILAFRSTRTGSHEIWVSDTRGRKPSRLTNIAGVLAGSPRWSPDGRFLAYDSRESGNADIYVISAAGGPSRRLTDAPTSEVVPSWSRDGKFVYFASDRTGRWEVWKKPVDGGAPVQVTFAGGFAAFESPDGSFVYYSGGPERGGVWRIPAARGPEQPVLPNLSRRMWGNWAVGRTAIYYIDYDDPENVRSAWVRVYHPDTGAGEKIWKLTNAPAAWDNGLAISPDERTIFFAQADRYGYDLTLLDNFR